MSDAKLAPYSTTQPFDNSTAPQGVNMFGLGPTELIIIAVIVLLIFGAKRLPEIGKGLGGALKRIPEYQKRSKLRIIRTRQIRAKKKLQRQEKPPSPSRPR